MRQPVIDLMIKEAGEALMNGKDLLAMDRERRTDH